MKSDGVAPSEDYFVDLAEDGSKCSFDVESADRNVIKKQGSDTGDSYTHAQCLIAPTRKACSAVLCSAN
ncbi:hypothetical protein PR048_010571 [Dryococelus australis]|uniref:Uncharacterized protein n=1 Tax=Dryococelus australis TaxID=614101 RepID=A0ABQ9I327_9NEOP|nr:hypothetical protein PR048_010571 [Dryococelus australis]